MKKLAFIIIPALGFVLFLAAPALALDMEYYTYGGFNPITQAFTKIALIFSDSGYQGLLFVVMVLGLLAGVCGLAGKGRHRRTSHSPGVGRAGTVRCCHLPGPVCAQRQHHRL